MTTMLHLPDSGTEEVILGVDTHKDVHVAALLSPVGVLLATRSFPATATGYRALVDWTASFGRLRRAGVEGTGCYGAALTRVLSRVGGAGYRDQPT